MKTPPTIEKFIRDICSVTPMPKSEARRMLEIILAEARGEVAYPMYEKGKEARTEELRTQLQYTTKDKDTFMKQFKDTKFAKNGGSCFECCDYEEMYKELAEREEGYIAEMIEKIEGMKKEKQFYAYDKDLYEAQSHNNALDQVINIINNK